MKNRNIFNRILNNNKALAISAIIISAAIWLIVSVEKSPETTAVIKNIAIDVGGESLETLGLESYGEKELTASVTVRGKNYIVEDKDISSKISVSADTSSVVAPGNYTLRLNASAVDSRSDFEIVSVEPSTLTVYFDVPVTDREFIIEPDVFSDGPIIADGFVAGNAIIDSNTAKVKVSGPMSEVNRITKLTANVEISEPLTENGSFETEFTPVTNDGSVLSYVTYNRDTKVTVKVPVYKIGRLPAVVDYTNRPSNYIDDIDFSVTVSPSAVDIGLNSNMAKAASFAVKTVDFSELKPGVNKFTVPVKDVEKANSCLILDEVEEFTVTVNVEGMKQRTFPAPDTIGYNAGTSGIVSEAVIPDFEEVTVVGPASVIDSLESGDITLVADLTKIESGKTGFFTVPVVCENNDSYWIYGQYTANAQITG